jgi:hypothetical protein
LLVVIAAGKPKRDSARPPSSTHTTPTQPIKSDYTRGIAGRHIKRGYTLMCQWAGPALLLPVIASFGLELASLWHTGELQRLLATAVEGDVTVSLLALVGTLSVLLAALAALYMGAGRAVYLLDFAIYKPPDSWKWSKPYAVEMARALMVTGADGVKRPVRVCFCCCVLRWRPRGGVLVSVGKHTGRRALPTSLCHAPVANTTKPPTKPKPTKPDVQRLDDRVPAKGARALGPRRGHLPAAVHVRPRQPGADDGQRALGV